MKPGDTMWIAYPESVSRVTVVELGTGCHNVRPGHFTDPVVVQEDGGEFVTSKRELFGDPLAAAIRSAELAAELDLD